MTTDWLVNLLVAIGLAWFSVGMWAWNRAVSRDRRALKDAVIRHEGRRRCIVCTHHYDKFMSGAPADDRGLFCSRDCYQTWLWMGEVERGTSSQQA